MFFIKISNDAIFRAILRISIFENDNMYRYNEKQITLDNTALFYLTDEF